MSRIIVLAVAAALVAGPPAAADYRPPRTPDGRPDLNGFWDNNTRTSLQRGPNFKALIATPEEIAASEARNRDRNAKLTAASDPNGPPPLAGDDVGDIESEWFDLSRALLKIDGQVRSSLIVEPADGRIPWTPEGAKLVEATTAAEETDFRGPETRAPDERCLSGVGGTSGPPMLPGGYNALIQIMQTPEAIAIVTEMVHDARIVRMGAQHGPTEIKAWLGDSIGWWEKDTLVVETVGQPATAAWRYRPDGILLISPEAVVTERFTRISATELLYDFKVEDAALLRAPWRAQTILRASDGPMYEYACHEGNYALPNILAGARAKEREAAAGP